MATYTIHLPPVGEGGVSEVERFRLVKDGLSPWAMLLWPVWFLAKRIWLGALGVYALWALVNGGLYWLGVPAPVIVPIWALLLLLIGLEAHSVERWTLARKGWQETGVSIAGNSKEAETRAAVALAEMHPAGTQTAASAYAEIRTPALKPQPASGSTVLGLFPEPRR